MNRIFDEGIPDYIDQEEIREKSFNNIALMVDIGIKPSLNN